MDFRFKRPNLEWRCEMVDGELQFQILYQNKEVFKQDTFEREVRVMALNGDVFDVMVSSVSSPEIVAHDCGRDGSRRVVIFLRGASAAFDDIVCTPSNRRIECNCARQEDLMFIVNSALRSISELVDKELSDGLSI